MSFQTVIKCYEDASPTQAISNIFVFVKEFC